MPLGKRVGGDDEAIGAVMVTAKWTARYGLVCACMYCIVHDCTYITVSVLHRYLQVLGLGHCTIHT